MIQSSPGDVRQPSLADDLKRIRLRHRAASLERVVAALRVEHEQRSAEQLPSRGLKLAIDEFVDELADVREELAAVPAHHEADHRVLGRTGPLSGAHSG